MVQFGGPVGTLEKLGDKGPAVAAALAQELGLGAPADSWHTARDNLAELAAGSRWSPAASARSARTLRCWRRTRWPTVTVTGGGKSSAMPHKSNPVLAEILVTLARYNATQLSGMHQALVHEQERSGAAWTLEWMVLPPMVVATGAALSRGLTLLNALQINAKN